MKKITGIIGRFVQSVTATKPETIPKISDNPKRLLKKADVELTVNQFNLCYRYYKKYFNTAPTLEFKDLFLLMLDLFNFEMNMWNLGKVDYSCFNKRSKEKHLRWLTYQLRIIQGVEFEGSLTNYVIYSKNDIFYRK